jgi:uncharacterized protein YdhG (YjbR/CyaY superfamily)
MAKQATVTVETYIASQPEAVQRVLTRVRRIIRKAMPGAEEVISYGIPAYKLEGRVALYFAGWKEHYSIYPSTERLVAEFGEELEPYEISKGTIRFPLSEPVPARLIEAIAKFRVREAGERKSAKTGKGKTAARKKGGATASTRRASG